MQPLFFSEDKFGNIGEGLGQTNFQDYIKLVAGTGTTLLVPSNAKHALFSCSTDFFVRYTSADISSTIYAASSSQASGVSRATAGIELNPVLRTLAGVTGLGLIAKAAGDLTISWYI